MYMPGLEEKTAKSKVLKKMGIRVDQYQKANHKVYLSLCIEKKRVDGKIVTVAKIDNCCVEPYAGSNQSSVPLKEEYTDLSRFSDDLKSIVAKVSEQL